MMFVAGSTVHVRYDGGSESDIDVPKPGTVQRELFDAGLEAGRIVVVPAPKTPTKG